MATDFSIVWSSSEDVAKFKSYFSLPEFVEFPTVIPGQHAYAYFYTPYNDIFQGSSDEKPPLLVRTHGIQLYLFLSFFLGILILNVIMFTASCDIRINRQKLLLLFGEKLLNFMYKFSISI